MTIALRFALVAGLAVATTACGDKKADSTAAAADVSTAAPRLPPPPPLPRPAATPGAQDWTQVYAATPQGGFRMGNPDAKVKLVEFASLTCPHCREFHEAAMQTIKTKYVASGNVSYEYRNFVLNGAGFCRLAAGPLPGRAAVLWPAQRLLQRPGGVDRAVHQHAARREQAPVGALPPEQQIAAMAEAGKLDAYVRARGIPRAKFDQCLADPKAQATLSALRTEASDVYKLTGTPGFIINGATQEGVYTWAALEPKLQAALQ